MERRIINSMDEHINKYQKRIFESFSQGERGEEKLRQSLDNLIVNLFSHDKPKDDNSHHQQLRQLKYKKINELCDVDVEVDFTMVYEDESGTENYYDFLGDLSLYDDLHPDSKCCMDLECLRDSYVHSDNPEVFDSYVKDITCNGKPSVMRIELKPQYKNYQESEFNLTKEEN